MGAAASCVGVVRSCVPWRRKDLLEVERRSRRGRRPGPQCHRGFHVGGGRRPVDVIREHMKVTGCRGHRGHDTWVGVRRREHKKGGEEVQKELVIATNVNPVGRDYGGALRGVVNSY